MARSNIVFPSELLTWIQFVCLHVDPKTDLMAFAEETYNPGLRNSGLTGMVFNGAFPWTCIGGSTTIKAKAERFLLCSLGQGPFGFKRKDSC